MQIKYILESDNIECHRHLGGSMSIDFVVEATGYSKSEVIRQMQFASGEQYGYFQFLKKFNILDNIVWTEELLENSIKDTCMMLENENTNYCWMDFSVNKYVKYMGWSIPKTIEFVRKMFDKYRPYGVGLVLSLKYESLQFNLDNGYRELLKSNNLMDMLIGIDMVGDETQLDRESCKRLMYLWNYRNKMTRAHVGEFCGVENIYYAINDLEVTNIAHGIRITEDPALADIARRKGIAFDIAIISNYVTGVLNNSQRHPIRDMMDMGLEITINSDDPVQCDTNLYKEYQIASDYLSQQEIDYCKMIAKKNAIKFII